MDDWITAFQTTWTSAAMWGELAQAGAMIGLAVIFGFGYRVIRKLVGGLSKGKARV